MAKIRSMGDEEVLTSTSSFSSTYSNKNSEKPVDQGELGRNVSNPVIYSWCPSVTRDSEQCSSHSLVVIQEENENDNESKSLTDEPLPPDIWLLGGTLGSRNALLVFKSSALANSSDLSIQEKPGYKLHITYKVLQAETKLLAKLLECHGINEIATNSSDFNLLWTGSHPKPGILKSLEPHQRVNHFPRSYELTRKDRLYKNIERMQYTLGHKHFDFIPQTFIMPNEFPELCSAHHRTKGPWIVKPVASSRGRGIFIVETPNKVPLDEPVVVAKYISNPLLVSGHKCDLRIYVVVTSFDPLIVYIYEEGLVRFATVKYDSSHKQLWNPCMHLCNYSINKYHSDYVKSDDPSAENVGHKWTLSALLRHLKGEGKDTAMLMTQIEDIVIKAILSSASSIISACRMFVANQFNCFELYGFDILIDEKLKPWLLEVNLSPSLGCDSPLDVRLKSAMLADLLTLVGIPAVDPILRPSQESLVSLTSTSKTSQLKSKLSNCRQVHSAEGLSNTATKKIINCKQQLTSEEIKILKFAKAQFERRGGFVRIFPTIDSWTKYSQYLDPTNGVPISGTSSSINNYSPQHTHNLNLLLYTHLFPYEVIKTKYNDRPISRYSSSLDRKGPSTMDNLQFHTVQGDRQNRYERKLSQGHRSALPPSRTPKEVHAIEQRRQIIDMLKSGKKLTQCDIRKIFSQYLFCVLKRIKTNPEQQDHVEIVLKFLQKASNYLRAPHSVKVPDQLLDGKDRAAIVARQLHEFLSLYNKETELIPEKYEKSNRIPAKLFDDFLQNARECDLEEILIHQTTHTVPTHGNKTTGFQGVLKCIPNIAKTYGGVRSFNKTTTKSKPLKISSLS